VRRRRKRDARPSTQVRPDNAHLYPPEIGSRRRRPAEKHVDRRISVLRLRCIDLWGPRHVPAGFDKALDMFPSLRTGPTSASSSSRCPLAQAGSTVRMGPELHRSRSTSPCCAPSCLRLKDHDYKLNWDSGDSRDEWDIFFDLCFGAFTAKISKSVRAMANRCAKFLHSYNRLVF
jgi:hypothetical protein